MQIRRCTPPNRFGVFREYTQKPVRDPEEGVRLHEFAESPAHLRPPTGAAQRDGLRPLGVRLAQCAWDAIHSVRDVAANSFAPSLDWTTFKLMEWQCIRSATKLQRLVDDVLTQPEFNPSDLHGFNSKREQLRLDEHTNTGGRPHDSGRWHELSVELHLPAKELEHEADPPPTFTVHAVWARRFMNLIVEAYESFAYHWLPTDEPLLLIRTPHHDCAPTCTTPIRC